MRGAAYPVLEDEGEAVSYVRAPALLHLTGEETRDALFGHVVHAVIVEDLRAYHVERRSHGAGTGAQMRWVRYVRIEPEEEMISRACAPHMRRAQSAERKAQSAERTTHPDGPRHLHLAFGEAEGEGATRDPHVVLGNELDEDARDERVGSHVRLGQGVVLARVPVAARRPDPV